MLGNFKDNLHVILAAALIAIGIFSLGYFSANISSFQKPPIIVERLTDDNDKLYSITKDDIIQAGSRVVASVNSDKYYYEWCGGVGRIKEENKVFFANSALAEAAGLILANNCK